MLCFRSFFPSFFSFCLLLSFSAFIFFPCGRFRLFFYYYFSPSSAFCCIFFSSMFCFSSYPVSRLSGLCLWWLSVPLMVVWPFGPFRLLRPIHLCLWLRLHRCLCVLCCLVASIRRFHRHLSVGSIRRFSAAIRLLRSLFSH